MWVLAEPFSVPSPRRLRRGSDVSKCSHLSSQPTAFLSIIMKGVKLAVITELALILQSFFPLLHHSCSILKNARKPKRVFLAFEQLV